MRGIKRNAYRSIILLVLVAASAISCSRRASGPRRIMENGIEVVLNGKGIYPLSSQPRALSLREEFRIDIEDEALAAAGLTDVSNVDVDSRGHIFLFRRGGNQGRVIFQFDDHGKLLKSFGTIGQGPGELLYPHFLRITATDEIPVYNQGAVSMVYLDLDGRLLRSVPVPTDHHFISRSFLLLPNGNYLAQYLPIDEQLRFSKSTLAIFDAHLKKIRDIRDFGLFDRPEEAKNLFISAPLIAVSDHAFFVNSASSASDIAAYDLDGGLIRLIRTPFPVVRFPPELKNELLDRMPKARGYESFRVIVRNMETYPPFQALFTDDRDRLFVSGFEKDPTSGANLCDVFSPDGVRILRSCLGYKDLLLYIFEGQTFDVVIKKDRCYCLREKTDGFKEVIVYSMKWT